MLESMFTKVGIGRVSLMIKNPRKIAALTEIGVEIAERIAHETGRTPHNAVYLAIK